MSLGRRNFEGNHWEPLLLVALVTLTGGFTRLVRIARPGTYRGTIFEAPCRGRTTQSAAYSFQSQTTLRFHQGLPDMSRHLSERMGNDLSARSKMHGVPCRHRHEEPGNL